MEPPKVDHIYVAVRNLPVASPAMVPQPEFIAAKGERIMVLGLNVPSTPAALDEFERGGYPLIAETVHGAGSFFRRSSPASALCTQRDSTACSWKSSTTKSRSPKRLAPPGSQRWPSRVSAGRTHCVMSRQQSGTRNNHHVTATSILDY